MRRLWIAVALLAAAGCSGDSSSCPPGHACPAACSTDSDCGADQLCTERLCSRRQPTSTDYDACALDADCAGGEYCSLGACKHDCLTDRDCADGAVCSSHGLCVQPWAAGKTREPSAPSKGKPGLDPALLDFGTSEQQLTFMLWNDGGEPFDFRILSSQPWLSAEPFEGRVSGQPVTIAVALDRAGAGSAESAYIAVNTSAGYLKVYASLVSGLTGTWAGSLKTTAPVALGQQGLAVNLTEADGVLSGWVDGERSFLYPFRAAISGSVTPGTPDDQVTLRRSPKVGHVCSRETGHAESRIS
jgi:hypothetical protein